MYRVLLIALFFAGVTFGAGPVRAQDFSPCADAEAFPELAGSGCATVSVPLHHGSRDDGATVDLFVRRFPAPAEVRGVIWLVAGGPGESGAAFYPFLRTLRQAFPHHDLMVPDHRGTGYSSRICSGQETADGPDGFALAGEEWGPCIGFVHADRARAHGFSITNAAHDLSFLIERYRQPGEVQVYGVSYGTQLVLRMMQVAPVSLDGIILDGLVPPENEPQWDLGRRTAVVDAVGRAYLDDQQEAAYTRLIAAADTGAPWRDRVPGGNLRQYMGTLLNFPAFRARIPAIVAELADDRTELLDQTTMDLEVVVAELGRYPQSSPSLPLVMLISGSENNSRRDLSGSTVTAEASDALFVSPLPGLVAANPLPLYDPDPAFGATPTRLPRTLVIHGTLDPNTAYDGALAHVAALRQAGPVELTTVEGGAHFLLFVAPACFIRSAGRFVEEREAPRTCSAD